MRTYKVRPDQTTDGGTCFVAAFDDAPDIGVQGTTANEAVETLLSIAGMLPVTAPTPERRVGEAELAEIVAMEWDGLRPDELRRNLALDLLDERAANARLTAEVERLTKDVKLHADGLERADLGYFAQSLRAALSLPTPAPEATE